MPLLTELEDRPVDRSHIWNVYSRRYETYSVVENGRFTKYVALKCNQQANVFIYKDMVQNQTSTRG